MPITLDDFHKLVKEVESLQRAHDTDQGALNQMMKQLREKFGCKTLEEAVRKLKEAQDERQGYLVKYNREYTRVRKKYRRVLKGKK